MQVEKWKGHERENKAKQKPVAKRCLFVFVVINFLCINQSINKCGGRMVVGSKSIILSFCQSHAPPTPLPGSIKSVPNTKGAGNIWRWPMRERERGNFFYQTHLLPTLSSTFIRTHLFRMLKSGIILIVILRQTKTRLFLLHYMLR